MTDDNAIRLIEPCRRLRDGFIEYAEEFKRAGEPFVHGDLDSARANFPALLQAWRDWSAGRNLRPDHVPESRYWLVRGIRILGTTRLRHRLSPALRDFGGHIGYEVRPSERGEGHATRMLAMLLVRARARGLVRVMLTCDQDNPASARVMEKNGGWCFSEASSERQGTPVYRYWIDLTGPPAAGPASIGQHPLRGPQP